MVGRILGIWKICAPLLLLYVTPNNAVPHLPLAAQMSSTLTQILLPMRRNTKPSKQVGETARESCFIFDINL